METIKIGILREGKVPPDKRVPLTPKQCVKVQEIYPEVKIIVQESEVRKFEDKEYRELGIEVQKDISNCDIFIGVKEVNIEDLVPNKTFMFFSHTYKKQSYNRDLLKAILDRNIQLIDYEVIKDKNNKRLIGFGRYAGIVGCYNAFRTFGLKHNLVELKAANLCANRKEMEGQLHQLDLPKNTKIVLTGFGRVGYGAREILDLLPILEVSPEEFLNSEFDEPIFTQLEAADYFAPKNGSAFVKSDFYAAPENYESTFARYANRADIYIPCHFWSNKSPKILTAEDLKSEKCKLSVIADISCDIADPIASTIRSSKIASPIYGYNPTTEQEEDFKKAGVIAVMAVDNLPCELPLDASEDFGNELIKHVLPALLRNDPDRIIERASETNLKGELTENFTYLQEYVDGILMK